MIDELDAVYKERNMCVALIARMAVMLGYTAGLAKTDIEGWDPEWHNCVYVDLPTGQVSWHFHDRDQKYFDGLPPYDGEWDGHDTPEKYRRVNKAFLPPSFEGDGTIDEPEGNRETPFIKELTSAINACCMENGSDTPDFILAEYLMGCLEAFEQATRARDVWHGPEMKREA